MLMVGFDGTTLPDSLAALLEKPLVSGVIWFARNVESPEQVARLNEVLRRRRPDLLIAVDQEGGPVRRLRDGVTDVPAMRTVRSIDEARRWGGVLGSELHALGFNMDMAPVLDVDSNPQNPIIGERSFGADPDWVARLGVALFEGLDAERVAACGKHFPGHGDTDQDSHLTLPTLTHNMARLRELELPPFWAAVEAGIPAIMTAHILFPGLDATRPATLSPTLLTDLLRTEMGFDGVIVSDDLEMRAVAERWTVAELVSGGIAAGVDLFLVCRDVPRQLEALRALDALAPERSRRRVAALARRYRWSAEPG